MDPVSPNLSPMLESFLMMFVEPNDFLALPPVILPAPVFYPPPFTLEGLGLLGPAGRDNQQYQGANLMDAYLDVPGPDEITRLPPMESDSPESLWSPSGFAFSSPEWNGQQTVNMADIYSPPVFVHPGVDDTGSPTDTAFDSSHNVTRSNTINDEHIVSEPAPWYWREDSNYQESDFMLARWQSSMTPVGRDGLDLETFRLPTPSGGGTAQQTAAPMGRQTLKRKASINPSDRPSKRASSSRTIARSYTQWDDADYNDEDSVQTDKEDGEWTQQRARKGQPKKKAAHKPKGRKAGKTKFGHVCRLVGCNMCFTRAHDRKRHEQTAIGHGATRAHKCPKCDSWFCRSDARDRHVTTHR